MMLRLTRTTVSLAVGITAAVATVFAAGAYFYSQHHFETLLESARDTALAQGDLIREALEHQMIENDRSLIAEMVSGFGRHSRIENVMLLDRSGVVRYSSGEQTPGTDLSISSPTCQACHQFPPSERDSSRVIEARGGTRLRTVIPFRNRAACHRCHDPNHAINGILILDMDVGEVRVAMNQDLRSMVAASGGLTLLLVAGIGVIVRVVVLRRLQRFETTARLIAGGDLDRRVPTTGGSDTITWLAREFNTMADSMSGLVGEVRHERQRLETIINSIDDGIVVLDPARNIIAANAAFLQRTGRVRDQVLGCGCQDAAPGMCTARDCPTLVCLAYGERQVRICERRTADGGVAWEEVHASPVRNAKGEITQVVEVWRDISERRAAEARLAESHRLASLGVLASGFSHEMNTPLATVLTCLEGILLDLKAGAAGQLDAHQIGETAVVARDQILRCRGITQHFLRLSRGQASAGDIVDLHPAVAAVTRLVEPTARAHSVKITVRPFEVGLQVRSDEAELQHTLVNLLLNAVQACAEGGRVALEVTEDTQVHIRVIDDGCGIAPEDMRRIFEPFFSMRKGGTGLGLFLSLNFVRHWGGDIRVGSAPGRGTWFEIVLPRPAEAAPELAS